MQEKGRKKSQEKRIILAFLREQAGVLLWVVFFIGIFCLLCFLENFPQDVTVYTLQLAFFSGIAVLIFRFIRYRKRCKTLELLTTDPRDKIEAFPNQNADCCHASFVAGRRNADFERNAGGTFSGGTLCADGITVSADGKDEHGFGSGPEMQIREC